MQALEATAASVTATSMPSPSDSTRVSMASQTAPKNAFSIHAFNPTTEPSNVQDATSSSPSTAGFSVFWLDGTLAGRVEAHGDFFPKDLESRQGSAFDMWSQRAGYIDNMRFCAS